MEKLEAIVRRLAEVHNKSFEDALELAQDILNGWIESAVEAEQ